MSKEVRSGAKPLSGIRILVGRARHQAGVLSAELRKLGADVIEIPFIEIRKPRSFKLLDAALKNLSAYDWLILTSVNGVEAMWKRMAKLGLTMPDKNREGRGFIFKSALSEQSESKGAAQREYREGHEFTRAIRRRPNDGASATEDRLRIAAIGPATKKAIEQRGGTVDIVPKEYVAESVVHSLKKQVKGKRVLLVRAKIARDVIPHELRKAGAQVDVVEAYETIVPRNSRRRLQAALKNPKKRLHLVTFTSSSTVRNFVELLGSRMAPNAPQAVGGQECPPHTGLDGILMASIGPVTSSTLRELGFKVDIAAKEFTIPGLVSAIVRAVAAKAK